MVTSVTPPPPKGEVTVHGRALVDVGGVCLAGLRTIALHVALGAESHQDGIQSLLGPLQWLTKAGDGDPGVALADLVGGGPERPTQGCRGDQPGQLFMVIEPQTQRLTESGIA
jgi:hypothetical protein